MQSSDGNLVNVGNFDSGYGVSHHFSPFTCHYTTRRKTEAFRSCELNTFSAGGDLNVGFRYTAKPSLKTLGFESASLIPTRGTERGSPTPLRCSNPDARTKLRLPTSGQS